MNNRLISRHHHRRRRLEIYTVERLLHKEHRVHSRNQTIQKLLHIKSCSKIVH